jgi:hypothetical protein
MLIMPFIPYGITGYFAKDTSCRPESCSRLEHALAIYHEGSLEAPNPRIGALTPHRKK